MSMFCHAAPPMFFNDLFVIESAIVRPGTDPKANIGCIRS